jgi:hypothetical protein
MASYSMHFCFFFWLSLSIIILRSIQNVGCTTGHCFSLLCSVPRGMDAAEFTWSSVMDIWVVFNSGLLLIKLLKEHLYTACVWTHLWDGSDAYGRCTSNIFKESARMFSKMAVPFYTFTSSIQKYERSNFSTSSRSNRVP